MEDQRIHVSTETKYRLELSSEFVDDLLYDIGIALGVTQDKLKTLEELRHVLSHA